MGNFAEMKAICLAILIATSRASPIEIANHSGIELNSEGPGPEVSNREPKFVHLLIPAAALFSIPVAMTLGRLLAGEPFETTKNDDGSLLESELTTVNRERRSADILTQGAPSENGSVEGLNFDDIVSMEVPLSNRDARLLSLLGIEAMFRTYGLLNKDSENVKNAVLNKT